MLTLLLSASLLSAPTPNDEGYRTPPEAVIDIVDAAPAPRVVASPDTAWLLFVERPSLPSIADLARPWIPLAGLRFDPELGSRHRVDFDTGLVLRARAGGAEQRVELPEGARVASVSWSHTSRSFAFTLAGQEGLELWVATVPGGGAKRVASGLNGMFGSGYTWMPDGERILAAFRPAGRGPAPEASPVPAGPTTMESRGNTSPVRTFQDLLADEHDAALFEYHGQSRLAIVDPATLGATVFEPALIRSFDPSPDGQSILVTRIERPFSYLMPFWDFPTVVEVWSALPGKVQVVAERPLAENVPIGGVPTGRRNVGWRPLAPEAEGPASLVFALALDGGDPKVEAEHRDRWSELAAPYDGEPRPLFEVEHRARGLQWLADGRRVVAGEYDRDRRWIRTTLRDLQDPSAEPVVLEDRSIRERYADPGHVAGELSARGEWVVRQDAGWIYRTGSGASPAGDRPFLDRQSLATLATERLWQCPEGAYERVAEIAPLAPEEAGELPDVLTLHESPTEPPNWRLWDLASGEARALTAFPDPTPELRGISKELVTYERADGVPLSATLYLPADYEPGTRLPLVVWAYPIEFNDARTAGQVSGSEHRFTRIGGSSHLFFLTQGYAVMDRATMPIIGDAETMNDTFVEQIVGAAEAAIAYADGRGVADGERVGVGGHSYGAFMTANLLAHCDLFDAGIARSGAYNRTLTPFGFQSERRTLWEARDTYAAISPFFHAEKIDEPLLMIHGQRDSNSGTYPIQSERMYHAIKGNGGTARLVMLPEEDHGYRARESVLHTLAEMFDWFDEHVKGGAVEAPVKAADAAVEASVPVGSGER